MISNIVIILVLLGGAMADSFEPVQLPAKLSIPILAGGSAGLRMIDVDLTPAESYLANTHLPVWLAKNDTASELTPMDDIMEEIGPFSVYRDATKCSAALYFHKTRQLHGTIANQYHIRGATYDPSTKTVDVSDGKMPLMSIPHHRRTPVTNKRPMLHPGRGMNLGVQSLGAYPETVYIETLVVVNADMAILFNNDYKAIVTHVLSIFNTADMLYSKIETPKIKLNIAGIIIGEKAGSLPEIRKCHQTLVDRGMSRLALNAMCTFNAIDVTLTRFALPLQSFDVVVFLSSLSLSLLPIVPGTARYEANIGYLRGQTRYPGLPRRFREEYQHTAISLVVDGNNMDSFPTLAHEMGHIFSALHDCGPRWAEDGSCSASLMRADENFCKNCIQFGGPTPMQFQMFFGGSFSCIYRNKPRSLENPRGPRVGRDIEAQCQCYGFNSAAEQAAVSGEGSSDQTLDCDNRLQCIYHDGKTLPTTFYADGTTCNANNDKVCWNKQCLPIVPNA